MNSRIIEPNTVQIYDSIIEQGRKRRRNRRPCRSTNCFHNTIAIQNIQRRNKRDILDDITNIPEIYTRNIIRDYYMRDNRNAYDLLNDYLVNGIKEYPLDEYNKSRNYTKASYWFHEIYNNDGRYRTYERNIKNYNISKEHVLRLLYSNILSPTPDEVFTFMKFNYFLIPIYDDIQSVDDYSYLPFSIPHSSSEELSLICIMDKEQIEDYGIIYDLWKDIIFLEGTYRFFVKPVYKDNQEAGAPECITYTMTDSTIGKISTEFNKRGLYFMTDRYYGMLIEGDKEITLHLYFDYSLMHPH